MQENSHMAPIRNLPSNGTGKRTYFVSVSGHDTHDGASWRTAIRTVSAALRLAGPGDEIRISEGEFLESGLYLTCGIALLGGFAGDHEQADRRDPHAHRTVLDGGGHDKPVLICRGEGILVDGCTVASGSSGACVVSGDSNFSHCTIVDNSGYGVAVDSGTLHMIHCVVAGNSGSGINVSNGGVAVLSGNTITGNIGHGVSVLSGNAALENNTIFRNAFDGVYVCGTARLKNNTIVTNAENGVCLDGCGSGTLINNIIVFHGGYGIQKASSRSFVLLQRNNVFGNSNGEYGGGTAGPSDISADPLFADSDNADFRLRPGSPCLSAEERAARTLNGTDGEGPSSSEQVVDLGARPLPSTLRPTSVLLALE